MQTHFGSIAQWNVVQILQIFILEFEKPTPSNAITVTNTRFLLAHFYSALFRYIWQPALSIRETNPLCPFPACVMY